MIAATLLVFSLLIFFHFRTQPDPDFSEITPGLYMGARVVEPPPGTAAVLNLCEIEDPYAGRVICQWSPIRDAAPAPSLHWLREQVHFVAEQRRADRTVYVHCLAGVSRSGLVVVAYLMQERGWKRDEALAFVRRGRPSARPNPAFMQLLSEWEQALRKI